jgi:Putative lumazine-binding
VPGHPEADAVRSAVLDYFEGWFEGDAERMDRALHPELAKRRAGDELGITSKARMVELTEAGAGAEDAGDGRIEIAIEDVYEDIASATVHTSTYHEYVHLVRTSGGWKVANTLWRLSL